MAASERRSSARVAPRSVRVERPTSTTIDGEVGGIRFDRAGAAHVADRAVADDAALDGLAGARRRELADRAPHAVARIHLALVREVQRRERDALALDVAPDVELGPVRDRERAHVLAGGVAAVVQAPQLGPLVARIPLAELVAQRDDPLLRARLVLVAARAAEDGVVAAGGDRVEQRQRLQRVAGAVGALLQAAVVDVVLHAGDFEPDAEALDGLVAEREHLGEVVAGVDVQHRERHPPGGEGLGREVEHHDGVLAAGEQQHGPLELGDDLADDVDRLGLEQVEGREAVDGASRPASSASSLDDR